MFIYLIRILLCFLLLSSIVHAQTPRPFIIDTDAGFDDMVAILYMLNRNDIDIKAISIAATGEADCKPALNNVASLFKLSHKSLPPMACGKEQPLEGHRQFPGWIKKQANTFMGMTTYLPKTILRNSTYAPTLLIEMLEKSSQPINILAIGPLTNLAEILQKKPKLVKKIKMIYIMGGAINVDGNINVVEPTIANKTAEWNFYIDPKAADIVLKSNASITLIPLDATNQVPIDEKFYQSFQNLRTNNPVAMFSYQVFTRNKQQFLTQGWFFWDALAAVVATDQTFFKTQKLNIRIALQPENIAGTTLIDEKFGKEIIVCKHVDAHRFNQVALQTMLPQTAGKNA